MKTWTGGTTRFGLCIALALGTWLSMVLPARAAPILYGVTFCPCPPSATPSQLISIDPLTGAGTLIGSLGNNVIPADIAFNAGNLYAYDQPSNTVIQLDPITGATVATINIGTTILSEGGMTFRSDGIGFLNGDAGGPLYCFNLATKSSSLITPVINPGMDGLAFSPGGVLYGISSNTSSLYTIDQTTGQTTLVGPLGVTATLGLGGLAFQATGQLFAAFNDELYGINPVTGAATLIGPFGFPDVSGIAFVTPAFQTPVPEPTSALLFGIGLLVLYGLRRRQRRSVHR